MIAKEEVFKTKSGEIKVQYMGDLVYFSVTTSIFNGGYSEDSATIVLKKDEFEELKKMLT